MFSLNDIQKLFLFFPFVNQNQFIHSERNNKAGMSHLVNTNSVLTSMVVSTVSDCSTWLSVVQFWHLESDKV